MALIALAWPALNGREIDSFPFSNYPMFAHPRRAVSSFDMAVLVDESGHRRRLDVIEISGTDQPMQAAMTLSHAIRTGSAETLCSEIADRLHMVGHVEVLTVDYDAVAWFRGERDPVSIRVRAACSTPRVG